MINLLDEFDKYFDQPECYGLRSERLYLELGLSNEKFAIVREWMAYTFLQGARTGYQHSYDIVKELDLDHKHLADIIMTVAAKKLQTAENEHSKSI